MQREKIKVPFIRLLYPPPILIAAPLRNKRNIMTLSVFCCSMTQDKTDLRTKPSYILQQKETIYPISICSPIKRILIVKIKKAERHSILQPKILTKMPYCI